MPLEFEFPIDSSGQWDGFNDPGFEHFAGSPYRSIGREATQNSLDAALSNEQPVKISIRCVQVDTESVPGIEKLRTTIKLCNEHSDAEGPKARQFFEQAVDVLRKPKISVLQISDTNTTGVPGPCQNGTPYFALMKATGQSKKNMAEERSPGGSFGIGKFAPFTVSALRTVFITTVWHDATVDSPQHYTQGKSILMSHVHEGQTHRGVGFWGDSEGCLPLVGCVDKLPEWLRRQTEGATNYGTTLSVIGFGHRSDWAQVLMGSIAESFFAAIQRGHLEVTLDGRSPLNALTIESAFEDPETQDSLRDQKNEPEAFQTSAALLRALIDPNSKREEFEHPVLGRCQLHILVADDLPKRVGVLRNGMLITTELDRLKRFNEFKSFIAVLECLSVKGNQLLRAMEPPAHDDFEPERLIDAKERKQARSALQHLATWVREMLSRHAQDPVTEETELDELAEFFGDETPSAQKNDTPEGNPLGLMKISIRAVPKKLRRPVLATATEDPDKDGEDEGGEGDDEARRRGKGRNLGDGRSPRTPTNPKPEPDVSRSIVSIRNVRGVPISPTVRRVSFDSDASGDIELQFDDSGADSNRALRIVATSCGELLSAGKGLRLSCVSGVRQIVDVEFFDHFPGTLRVRAYAI